MANHTTGAQRHNVKMNKIFGEAGPDAWKGKDMRSEAMKKSQAKSKALKESKK